MSSAALVPELRGHNRMVEKGKSLNSPSVWSIPWGGVCLLLQL